MFRLLVLIIAMLLPLGAEAHASGAALQPSPAWLVVPVIALCGIARMARVRLCPTAR